MRKVLFIAFAFFAMISKAQDVTTDNNYRVVSKVNNDKYKVETNRFWSNWFIGIGAGAQMYFGDHNKQLDFSDRISPAFNFSFGKWFTPGIGARLMYSGRTVKGATQNDSYYTGKEVPEKGGHGYWLKQQEFDYAHFHGDVLFNLSNMFCGYNEKRFWNLSIYPGLGIMLHEDHPRNEEVAMTIGVLNTFRLSKALDLTLDVMGSMVNDRFDGEHGNREQEGPLSVTLGLTYKFKQRGWNRSTTTTVYDETEINRLRGENSDLNQLNEKLRGELADAKRDKGSIQKEKVFMASPAYVTFKINKWDLSKEARVNLGLFAETIKKSDPDAVYVITGYADAGTGNNSINQKLSERRAKAVYDCLVKEFGVSEKQLEIDFKGGVDNMYYNDPRLSRAVITKIK